MSEYISDTDSLLCHLTSGSQLGEAANRIFCEMERGEHTIWVPAIVYAKLMECDEYTRQGASKFFRGKEKGRYRVLPLDDDVLEFLEIVPAKSVADIVDRVIIATAMMKKLPVITSKDCIVNCQMVPTIWDKSFDKITIKEISIFFSYAKADRNIVETIYQKFCVETQLSDMQFKAWVDFKKIHPGEDYEGVIRKAIRSCDFFLAFMSPNSIRRRGLLQKEINDALDIWAGMMEDDIYLIPVLLEDCEVPERLRPLHHVKWFEEGGWSNLLEAIREGMQRRHEKR